MSSLNIEDLKSDELTEVNCQELEKVVGGDKIIQIFNPFAFYVPGGGGGGGGHAYGHYKH
jgi:hypothetical protein